jgi:hypothetical protein
MPVPRRIDPEKPLTPEHMSRGKYAHQVPHCRVAGMVVCTRPGFLEHFDAGALNDELAFLKKTLNITTIRIGMYSKEGMQSLLDYHNYTSPYLSDGTVNPVYLTRVQNFAQIALANGLRIHFTLLWDVEPYIQQDFLGGQGLYAPGGAMDVFYNHFVTSLASGLSSYQYTLASQVDYVSSHMYFASLNLDHPDQLMNRDVWSAYHAMRLIGGYAAQAGKPLVAGEFGLMVTKDAVPNQPPAPITVKPQDIDARRSQYFDVVLSSEQVYGIQGFLVWEAMPSQLMLPGQFAIEPSSYDPFANTAVHLMPPGGPDHFVIG